MFKSYRCFALIIYHLMITCFTTIVSSMSCLFVWFDSRRNYTRVGQIVIDSCFFFWMVWPLLLISSVESHTGSLMFASCLDVFLVLGPLHLTNIIWDSWSFLSAPQAILFPQRMLCNLLIQLFISGLVLHMLFQIFNFDVVFDSVA